MPHSQITNDQIQHPLTYTGCFIKYNTKYIPPTFLIYGFFTTKLMETVRRKTESDNSYFGHNIIFTVLYYVFYLLFYSSPLSTSPQS